MIDVALLPVSVALLLTSPVGGVGGVGEVGAVGGAIRSQASGPRMEIEPESFDFGRVPQNTELVHEFVLRNVGSEDLEVKKLATSCGCAAAIVSDRIIAPGKETVLRVTLETRRYRGRKERTVSIASNDRRRVLQIRLQAFIEAPD